MTDQLYVLPEPKEMVLATGHFTIGYDSAIVIGKGLSHKVFHFAKTLAQGLFESAGYTVAIEKGLPKKGAIYLDVEEGSQVSEAYSLKVTTEAVEIIGSDEAGLLYGIETLKQLMVQQGPVLQNLTITDRPALAVRGYYFDATRGRIPTMDSLKHLVRDLHHYKINQLQLYVEHSYLFEGMSEIWRDDTPLTAEDFLELDAYCDLHHIELVPSLSVFGHMYKILESQTYGYLCECPDASIEGFSFDDRMAHHTIDVSHEDSLVLVEKMLQAFMPLFSSDKFNICGDETFDLGNGKNKALADEVGKQTIYIQFLNKLCDIVKAAGKQPMFWGDVIAGHPERIKDLPEDIICLNWGYAPNEMDINTKAFHEAGANQYVCPGVGGWNQWINLYRSAYENIKRMGTYAKRYEAIGVLNTDWGDYGHINHPELSKIPMIYGSAFSWTDSQLSFDMMNQQISRLYFRDPSESVVSLLAEAGRGLAIEWRDFVLYKEKNRQEAFNLERHKKVQPVIEALEGLKTQLYGHIHQVGNKSLFKAYLVALDGMIFMQKVFGKIGHLSFGFDSVIEEEADDLAIALETWFMAYKKEWRRVSKESELYRVQEVINWYGDTLRQV